MLPRLSLTTELCAINPILVCPSFTVCTVTLNGGIGICWKVTKRTPFRRGNDIDIASGLEFFEALSERDGLPENIKDRIMAKVFLKRAKSLKNECQKYRSPIGANGLVFNS